MEILTTSWIVPVSGPPLAEGRVAVHEGKVAWVGREGDAGHPAGPIRDLGPGVLLPGLVNAHCHLELSHLHGRVDGSRGFVPWVRNLVALRASDGVETVREAVAAAIQTVVATGTVAVGDVSNALSHLDVLAASGLEAVVYHELLAWDPRRAASSLEAADQMWRTLVRTDNVHLRLAAHAPYSVSADLMRALVERGGPWAIHLAESAEESRFLATGDGEWARFLQDRVGDIPFTPPGVSPVRYLESLGVLHPGLVAAHCVQIDAADRAILARTGVHVVVCPRSNRTLGVGIPPVPELLTAGVPVCLGTDSLASAGTLNLLDDVVALRSEFPGLSPEALIFMATQAGARALGLEDLGSLAPGKRAALAHAAAGLAPRDPFAFLVSGEARLRPVYGEGRAA